MADFNYPNINMNKSNEENMQAIRAYLIGLSDTLRYVTGQMETEIMELKAEIKALKEGM